ncbi:IBR domain-containing protein [Colletotrichum chrysophilum]|uniref:RBR-type E3 ubiquitin transferase n=1 Tax=Colletotrichum chrysophilum TaxID=1836956 RepID=A0AAD9EPD5_9PEZI|nr:IBR domain-containing protein [Colletotrichum chrysophilum]
MEQFQLLDEHVSNLILRFGFLDVEDLPFATAEEVENAAALALQMAAPEELIEIAVRQSAHRHPHPNPPRAAAAVPARPVPRRPPPLTEPEPEDPNPGAYIDWQERNRILADSPVEPDDGAEEGGEDCIICSGGREPKLQLPCGCWFCAPCLRGCIRAGLRQGGWPPKCCEPLQNDAIRWVRRPGLLRLYRQVREEQETPGDQRVYCSRPGCAAFIPAAGPHVTADLMRCRACGEGTCRMCRAAIHPGRPCREEEEDEMLMDIMDRDNLASCPTCRRIVELWDGCNHITCECGHQWCFLCGGDWRGGCPRGCPQYGGRERRVPMRQRVFRYQQGRGAMDHHPRIRPQGAIPDALPPPAEPPNLLELQRQVIAEQPPLPPALQARVVPRPMPQVLPFVPVVEDGFEGHPANFDPDFGGALPLIDVGDGPEPDHIDPEPIMANANGQARGQQRYYIMMFYADGNNTEVGDPNWRRDSPENMRRIREGDETEGRVWPQYAIEREEGRCNHQTHAQWEFQPREEPPCFYCRIRDGRQLWHCRSCGVTACDWHRFLRFGLTWQQANRTVNNLRNRVTVDSDFRYPRANANRIEAWDLFLEGVRPRRPRRGQRAQRAERAPRAQRPRRGEFLARSLYGFWARFFGV